jgi:hypothetical protein
MFSISLLLGDKTLILYVIHAPFEVDPIRWSKQDRFWSHLNFSPNCDNKGAEKTCKDFICVLCML